MEIERNGERLQYLGEGIGWQWWPYDPKLLQHFDHAEGSLHDPYKHLRESKEAQIDPDR